MPDPRPRVVRVFVSSTFRDMQAEREELVKRVFPELRRLCDARGVVWGEVDLRWGIPDEAAAEHGVLPICLEEIRRCRPFFIGGRCSSGSARGRRSPSPAARGEPPRVRAGRESIHDRRNAAMLLRWNRRLIAPRGIS
jgi:hypothetical protein